MSIKSTISERVPVVNLAVRGSNLIIWSVPHGLFLARIEYRVDKGYTPETKLLEHTISRDEVVWLFYGYKAYYHLKSIKDNSFPKLFPWNYDEGKEVEEKINKNKKAGCYNIGGTVIDFMKSMGIMKESRFKAGQKKADTVELKVSRKNKSSYETIDEIKQAKSIVESLLEDIELDEE